MSLFLNWLGLGASFTLCGTLNTPSRAFRREEFVAGLPRKTRARNNGFRHGSVSLSGRPSHTVLLVFIAYHHHQAPLLLSLTSMKLTCLPILDRHGPSEIDLDGIPSPRQFVDLMDEHKALLIRRDDSACTVENFGEFVVGLNLEYYPYVGGAAPRRIIPVQCTPEPVVFTANER